MQSAFFLSERTVDIREMVRPFKNFVKAELCWLLTWVGVACNSGRMAAVRHPPKPQDGQTDSRRAYPPREDLTAKLLTRFKELLQNGSLAPGTKLPSERDLARRFNVSRSSLRQAFKMLDMMGVLNQRVGDGTYLNLNASSILAEPMEFLLLLDGISFHELYEARLVVEPEIASRAAERATAADVEVLRAALNGMESSLSDMHRFIELDVGFHEAIFRASGNRVFVLMFSGIQRFLLTGIARTSPLVDFSHTLRFHRRIFSAINKRQPEEARRAMADHLVDARSVFLTSVQTSPDAALNSAIVPIKRSTAFQKQSRRRG
jgi:GntR family transcriptional repressor for pyruvate dehydrogenase complex